MHQRFHDFVTDWHLAGILDIGKAFKNRLPVKSRQLVKDQRADASGNSTCRGRRYTCRRGNVINVKRLRRHVGKLYPGRLGKLVHHHGGGV